MGPYNCPDSLANARLHATLSVPPPAGPAHDASGQSLTRDDFLHKVMSTS